MLIKHLKKTEKISEKTLKTIRLMLIPLGVSLFATGNFIARFFPENRIVVFISGMLMGLSVVANITGIIAYRHYLKK